ncbi:hypothetical protein BDFG_02541 [Blastomyces dermatitidis ATCC 26199]|nr:hypothetical protein BDFG_02541 [Blastomyces dermatitidis ATCC 26199]
MTADREQRGREIQQDTWRRRRSSTGGWFCYCAGCESFQDENDDEDEDEYDNGTMTMTIMVMMMVMMMMMMMMVGGGGGGSGWKK